MVCVKLHNYIIDSSGGSSGVPRPSEIDISGHTEPTNHAIILQEECDTEVNMRRRRRDPETSSVRVRLTNGLQQQGILRSSMS